MSRTLTEKPAPVFFDFGEEYLHCLLPVYIDSKYYIVEFPRNLFIELHNKDAGKKDYNFEDCLNKLPFVSQLFRYFS